MNEELKLVVEVCTRLFCNFWPAFAVFAIVGTWLHFKTNYDKE